MHPQPRRYTNYKAPAQPPRDVPEPKSEHVPLSLEAAAYERAMAIADREKPTLDSFIHVEPNGRSNQRQIEEDKEHIELKKATQSSRDREERKDPELQKLAKTLEVALYDCSNELKWFGESATMYMTTDYDDFENGVDSILEFEEQSGATKHMGLATDITYNQDPSYKFSRIKNDLDAGRLGSVKYFRSKRGDYQGWLHHLPRVVIMMNREAAQVMVRGWQQGKVTQNGLMKKIILRQISLQLEKFQQYAASRNTRTRDGRGISEYFTYARNQIDALLQESVQTGHTLEEIDSTPPIQELKMILEEFDSLPTHMAHGNSAHTRVM